MSVIDFAACEAMFFKKVDAEIYLEKASIPILFYRCSTRSLARKHSVINFEGYGSSTGRSLL
jgi:hypothetical protein